MDDFVKQFSECYRLTTAEIFYHMPDYPKILQTYIWQDYDLAPKFPVLTGFLDFWTAELDGKLHSITMASSKIVTPADFRYADIEITIQ